jgi:hypothetical protein
MVHQTWTDDQISFLQEGSIGVIPRYTTMFFVMATTMFFVMALNENNSISVETSGDDTENSLKIKAPISDRNLLVHLCGNYPNRYLSYERKEFLFLKKYSYLNYIILACPESPHKDDDGSKCRKGGLALGIECIHSIDCPLYADYRTECSDKGHCCTVSERTGYVWESCDNGGYFISSPCKTKTDCEKNLAMLQGKRQPRWEKFEQTCHRGECCTVAAAKDGKTNEEIPHPPAVDDGEGRDDLEEGYNDDHKRKKTCKSRGGYELAQNCVGNRDCNRILGLRLEEREQIECVAHRCCVSPRRLPKGMSNLKACPDGGHFLGKFCHKRFY